MMRVSVPFVSFILLCCVQINFDGMIQKQIIASLYGRLYIIPLTKKQDA